MESYKSSWRFSDYNVCADSSEVISQSSVSDPQQKQGYFYNIALAGKALNKILILFPNRKNLYY